MTSGSTNASDAPNSAGWKERFPKLLETERGNGFDDRAVYGGIDAFAHYWQKSLTEFLETIPGAPDLLRHSYARMSLPEREQWAAQWRALLETGRPLEQPDSPEEEPATPLPPPAPETHETRSRLLNIIEAAPPLPPAPEPGPASPPATARAAARKKPAPSTTEPPPDPATSPAIEPGPEKPELDAPVSRLKRVDAKLSGLLNRLGIATIRDLLYHFPREHQDYSRTVRIAELAPEQEVTVAGRLWEMREVRLGRRGARKSDAKAVLSDATGNVEITWFGQGFLARHLKPGSRIAVSGKVGAFQGRPVFEGPEYDDISRGQTPVNTGRLAPVYPLTAGLTARNLRRLTWQTLNDCLAGVEDPLPPRSLARTGLLPLQPAIRQAHYPDSFARLEQARRRLAFDELLTLQLWALARRQRRSQVMTGVAIEPGEPGAALLDGLIASLPFTLTQSQRESVDQILADLRRETPPMSRLLQGDVGNGKTIVALLALLSVIAAGYQGAIMVPTEVVAEQHFQTVARFLEGLSPAPVAREDNLLTAWIEALGRPVTVGQLTGSTRARPRRKLTGMAADGSLDLLIGTHALIQEGVELPRLALAVLDEQHRFGVMQRSALREKSGENPHILVMSATPIPRTLSLTIHGDLDVSTIDEPPPGRPEVRTRWLGPERRGAAYGFIQREVQAGRQAFIVHPLIDESDAVEAKAATEEYARLSREVFPNLRLALLHGRMAAAEKDRVMRRFRDGELDILVTTAVIEVGIDVPNATIMLIEGADRFGLAQLHQFRGRVGRGEHQSYCILMSDNPSAVSDNPSAAKERLAIALEQVENGIKLKPQDVDFALRLAALEQTRNGFELAEVDMKLRGPGDFFGTRQSGLPNLRMAHLSDRELLDLARQEAIRIMEQDPALALEEHTALAAQVARFAERASAEFS